MNASFAVIIVDPTFSCRLCIPKRSFQQTMCASAAAGSMRIMLMPVDAWKTIKQARPCVLQRNKTQFTVRLFADVFTGSWCGWSESSCVESFEYKQVFVAVFTIVCRILTQDDQCQRWGKSLGLQHVVARFPRSGDRFCDA